MQLPRGTFREIKKRELVSSILAELEGKKFSGICSISSVVVSGTLVFKAGLCILAKIPHKSGDGALEELRNKSGLEVDAALSSLDEAQIQLALEFNKACRIVKGGKTAPSTTSHPQKNIPVHNGEEKHGPEKNPFSRHTTAAAPMKGTAAAHKPATAATPPLRASSSFTAPPAKKIIPPPQAWTAPVSRPSPVPLSPVPAPHITPPVEPEQPAETEESAQGPSSFEKDIDTFDTLDIDNVTDKIRNDCKTMIKQLQLEHLMER
jgi:hypothetical protein